MLSYNRLISLFLHFMLYWCELGVHYNLHYKLLFPSPPLPPTHMTQCLSLILCSKGASGTPKWFDEILISIAHFFAYN